jgi:predicted dinucleotide-binding enzyme
VHIGIIGGGFIATILAGAFQRAGHDVVIGSRRSRSRPDAIPVASPAEAVAAADVVVLAQPGSAVEDFLRDHGDALAGKLIVDATNDFGATTAHHADAAARLVPQARYARAFNSYGGEVLAEPAFGTETADLFYVSQEADRGEI